MIYLTTGQNNIVWATCSRNKTLANPNYLWSMTHKLTNKSWKFLPFRLIPSTTYTTPYDLFAINIDYNTPEIYTGATSTGSTVNIHFTPGQYYIKIYEQTSSTNLNPNLASDVVWESTATVIDPSLPPNNIVSYPAKTDIFKVYEG